MYLLAMIRGRFIVIDPIVVFALKFVTAGGIVIAVFVLEFVMARGLIVFTIDNAATLAAMRQFIIPHVA